VLVSGLDGWNSAICNQFAKGIFGDLGFGIKLLEVVSRLFDTSDFTHSITSCIMVANHQSHMNALEENSSSAWYLTLKNLLATFATHPWRWGHSGLRWRGCHNSTASFYSCAAEFPPSL